MPVLSALNLIRGWKALPAILLFLLFSCTAIQAQETGNLVGQVRLSNGSFPAERVMVTLQTRGATLDNMYTDNEGRFAFYNLISNPYHLVIEDEAYQPYHSIVRVDPKIQQTTHVHVVLVPRETAKPPSPPSLISGSNPNIVNSADYTKSFPPDVIKEFEAGVKADELNQPEKAVAHYLKAIQLAPNCYPAHNNLGTRYLSKSDFRNAENEFREVLKLNKDDAQAYFNLGNVFYLTKRFDDARQILQEGLAKSPNYAPGNYLLGSVLLRLGDADAAERLLLTAKQLDPEMPRVLIELATLYLQTGKKDQAMSQLEEFLRRFPKDPLVPKVKEKLKKLEAPAR
jgi:tetratricopeptide (TPR) repeat protein